MIRAPGIGRPAASPPAWLVERPIAHRGLHDARRAIPENTLAAFRAAIRAGHPIELDTRLSADGRAMVFHDCELERLTDLAGPVVARTAAELGQVRVLGTVERIPTLDKVLDLVAGRVPLLIELKIWTADIGALGSEVRGHLRGYEGAVAVQSFNPLSLAWFRRLAPEYARGQISGDFRRYDIDQPAWRGVMLGRMQSNRESAPDFIGYDVRDLPSAVAARARRRGLPVLAWTVRNRRELARAHGHADGVIFEGIRP